MKAKDTFDLASDWNYLPSLEVKENDGKSKLRLLPRKELDGLRYDDLMELSWTILEEYD